MVGCFLFQNNELRLWVGRNGMNLSREIEKIIGESVSSLEPLSGGCVGQVYKVTLAGGRRLVAKMDEGSRPILATEGYMLTYLELNSKLPVPHVIYCEEDILLMAYLPGRNRFSAKAQEDAAVHLAALHNKSAKKYGFPFSTLIGGLRQPNRMMASWIDFFREQRLLYMAKEAMKVGRLPEAIFARLDSLAGKLDKWLVEPERPSLIHGDAWTGNILAENDRITGFIDPAIYYADPEIELAFTTLFGTFGEPFFNQYASIRPIAPGFFEERRHLYNLYPLLVHVRLFGGSYVSSVEQTLQQFGE
jgi:fructosamine-3-kinase